MTIRKSPAMPTRPSVPESGTTLTDSSGSPRTIVPTWYSANDPSRPSSVPVTRSTAVYTPDPCASPIAVIICPGVVATRSPVICLSMPIRPSLAAGSAFSNSSGLSETVNSPFATLDMQTSRLVEPSATVKPAGGLPSFGKGGRAKKVSSLKNRSITAFAPPWAGNGAPADDRSPRSASASGFVVVLVFRAAGLGGLELLAQFRFQLCRDCRVLAQVGAGVVLALADALVAVAVPGTGFLDQLGVHAHVDQFPLAADALAVQDLGDHLLERRRQLVLDHLDLGLVADDLVALLDRADAADVEADGGVELQRVAAGGHFRALPRHHHAD